MGMVRLLALAAALLSSRVFAAEPESPKFQSRWLEPYFQSGPMRAAAERFRVEDWKGAAADIAAAHRRLAKGSPERDPAEFLLALAEMNLNLWQQAGARFEALFARYPVLAPWHAYYAAR